jgi:LysM repeat protein
MLGKQNKRGLLGGGILFLTLLTLTLLTSGCGCIRPVYNETPTAETPPAAPIATLVPTDIPPTGEPTSTPTPVISGPPLLLLEPSVVLGFAVGETRPVQVLLENIEGLREIELHISFEGRYIAIEDANTDVEGIQIEPGKMPAPVQVMENKADNQAGFIVYHVAQEEGTSARGSGVVATFTVRALAEGGSPLQFTIVKLYDANGEPIAAPEQIDGLVTIGGGSVAEPKPTAEATGESAEPNATAIPTTAPVPTAPSSAAGTKTVQAGETLYQVCRRHCPHKWPSGAFDAELRTYAQQVAELNGLGWPDPIISPGQTLQMPACP